MAQDAAAVTAGPGLLRTPERIRVDVERRLERSWATELATSAAGAGERFWPHAFPLGNPTAEDLARAFSGYVEAAGRWRGFAREHGLALRTRTRRVLGTDQVLPTHLEVPDLDTAAALVAGPWPDRVRRGAVRAALLVRAFGHLGPAGMLGRTVADVDDLSDVDVELLCRTASWFAAHDATGLTPRQVPVEGLHAKWLEHRQPLVRRLAGLDDLGLNPPHPQRVHFAYLDPGHLASGGRRFDSVTVGDAMAPAYLPEVVVISENKDTAIHFPPLARAISVEGAGRGALTPAAVPWLARAPLVVYWGDMDADGLEILDGFRAAGIDAVSILMDLASFERWERFGTSTDPRGRPLAPRPARPVGRLTAGELSLYERLVAPDWTRARRIEQERIPLNVALAAVTRLTTAGV